MNNKQLTINEPLINLEKVNEVFDFLDIKETTRKDYKYNIIPFITFIKENGLNSDSFLNYKRHLALKNNFAISTKNKHLATAKIFLKELNRRGILPADITQNIKSFRQSKRHKKEGLTEQEINKLTARLNRFAITPKNTRIKAAIALLTLQGLRQIEVVRLDVTDLDFINKTAFIQGKGSDDKELINLHDKTIKHLKN